MVHGFRSRRAVIVLCVSAVSMVTSGAAQAFPTGSGDDTLTPSERVANHANELYQQGAYREAIAAYTQASELDPNGPNAPVLVRNIAVLHEKLGEVDDALTYFRKYGQMDISADDRRKNLVDIRRLEGAKKELEEKEAAQKAALLAAEQQNGGPAPEEPSHGRIDALTIGFAAGAGALLVVGTVFGVKAEAGKPSSGYVTGRDGTYDDLVNRTNVAHNDAVVADVSFGVGLAAAVTAVLLYALRTKDAPQATASPAATTPGASAPSTSAFTLSPARGGGGFVFTSRF